MKTKINFFLQETKFSIPEKTKIKKWISNTFLNENKQAEEINIIFCSDNYLSTFNKQYLKHDTLTDIITFNYTENQIIKGELFISIDRVRENSTKFKVSVDLEAKRVVIHGILHLCGYNDKNKNEKIIMRNKEDEYLCKYASIR